MKRALSNVLGLIAVAGLAVVSATATAFAQSEPEFRYFHPGMMWGDGYWGGFSMIFGPLFMLILLAAVVAVIFLALRALGLFGSEATLGRRNGNPALDILKERFAKGEIDAEDFDQRKRLLTD